MANMTDCLETDLQRWERLEVLDPNCPFCREEFYDLKPVPVALPFMPRHKASPRCQSGKRNHCTCDTCF